MAGCERWPCTGKRKSDGATKFLTSTSLLQHLTRWRLTRGRLGPRQPESFLGMAFDRGPGRASAAVALRTPMKILCAKDAASSCDVRSLAAITTGVRTGAGSDAGAGTDLALAYLFHPRHGWGRTARTTRPHRKVHQWLKTRMPSQLKLQPWLRSSWAGALLATDYHAPTNYSTACQSSHPNPSGFLQNSSTCHCHESPSCRDSSPCWSPWTVGHFKTSRKMSETLTKEKSETRWETPINFDAMPWQGEKRDHWSTIWYEW